MLPMSSKTWGPTPKYSYIQTWKNQHIINGTTTKMIFLNTHNQGFKTSPANHWDVHKILIPKSNQKISVSKKIPCPKISMSKKSHVKKEISKKIPCQKKKKKNSMSKKSPRSKKIPCPMQKNKKNNNKKKPYYHKKFPCSWNKTYTS